MAQPLNRWQDIVNDLVLVMQGIQEGADYRHSPKVVTDDPKAIDQVDSSDWPFILVVDGDGTGTFMPQLKVDTAEFIIQAYIGKDENRWPGKSSPQLARELKADILKAVETKPDRGGCHMPEGEVHSMAHDIEGRFSVVVITLTYRMKRGIAL